MNYWIVIFLSSFCGSAKRTLMIPPEKRTSTSPPAGADEAYCTWEELLGGGRDLRLLGDAVCMVGVAGATGCAEAGDFLHALRERGDLQSPQHIHRVWGTKHETTLFIIQTYFLLTSSLLELLPCLWHSMLMQTCKRVKCPSWNFKPQKSCSVKTLTSVMISNDGNLRYNISLWLPVSQDRAQFFWCFSKLLCRRPVICWQYRNHCLRSFIVRCRKSFQLQWPNFSQIIRKKSSRLFSQRWCDIDAGIWSGVHTGYLCTFRCNFKKGSSVPGQMGTRPSCSRAGTEQLSVNPSRDRTCYSAHIYLAVDVTVPESSECLRTRDHFTV